MSSYDTPYLPVDIAALANNTANRATQVASLMSYFADAGWQITIIPTLIRVDIGAGIPTFTVCDLGPSNQNNWGVKVSSSSGFSFVSVDSDDSCFTSGFEQEYTYLIPVTVINYQIIYEAIVETIIILNSTGYLPGIPTGDKNSPQQKLAGLLKMLFFMSPNLVFYEIVDNGDGTFSAYLGTPENLELIQPVDYDFDFGGQLNTNSFNMGGNGFIATSPANRSSDNYAEVYVFYETADPVNAARANQIRFAHRSNGRFLDNINTHPLLHHWNDVGAPTSISSNYVGLECHQNIKGFVGPYWYDLVGNPTSSTLMTSVWGGALRIKRIEGEVGNTSIEKLLISGGTNQVTTNNNKSLRNGPRIGGSGRTIFTVKALDIPQIGYVGNATIAIACLSNTEGTNLAGIVWPGGIANIFEPWIGWNWYNPDEDANEKIPLIGMLPNAITLWRANDLGNPPSSDESFSWDGRTWKYWQIDNHPGTGNNPSTGLAYVVG